MAWVGQIKIACVTALIITACSAPSPPIAPTIIEPAVVRGVCLVQISEWRLDIVELNGNRRTYDVPFDRPWPMALSDRVSPDGRYVVGHDSVANNLVGVALDGRLEWQIPNLRGARPAISADGRRVAAISSGDARLAIYDVSAGELRTLPVSGDYPAWAPAGDRLAYVNGQNVYIYDLTTNAMVDRGPGAEPSWLSDGKSVAVRVGSKVELVNVTTGERSELFADARGRSVPRWSPDGEWMMYLRRGGRTPWSIDWSGSEPTQVMLRHASTGTEASVAQIAKGNHGDYTWTTNAELCRSIR